MFQATRNALNRLLHIHCRSFVQYLRYARPHMPGSNQDKMETIDQIAEDQHVISERIIGLLHSAAATPEMGNFPMEFTDMHDLSLDYVVKEAIRYQRQDLRAIEECVAALKGSPSALAVAEEALGMAQGHLQNLEELLAAPDGAVASSAAGVA